MLGSFVLGGAAIGDTGSAMPLPPFAASQIVVRDDSGAAVSAASLTVYKIDEEGDDNGLADLVDDTGTPITNPVTTDANGVVRFRTAGGTYNLEATKDSFTKRWNGFQVGTAAGYDTGAEDGKIPLWEELPSGGGGGGIGPIVINGDAEVHLDPAYAAAGSPVFVVDGSDGIYFWDPVFDDPPPSGVFYVVNASAEPVLLNPNNIATIYKAVGAGTHLDSMGTLIVVVIQDLYASALISGDIITPEP